MLALLALTPSAAPAATTVVTLTGTGGAAGPPVFRPDFIRIQPGDKIIFTSAAPGQTVTSIAGMLPQGAAPIRGKADPAVTVIFPKDGVYGLKSEPGYAAGMVALVVAGKPANELAAEAIRHPPAAQRRFDGFFATLDGR